MIKISKTHLDNTIKILQKERFMREQVFNKDTRKKEQKVAEIDYCISFIKALYAGYEEAKGQGKLF